MINLQDIRNFVFDNDYRSLIDLIVAIDIAQINLVTISEDETLYDAFKKFGVRDNAQIPVVSKKNPKKVVGLVSKNFARSLFDR